MTSPSLATARAGTEVAEARMWPHLLALAAVVTVLVLLSPVAASFTSDDGAYGTQVRSLADDGRWVLDRPVPVVPVDNEGLVNGWRTPEGPVAHARHPMHILALRAGAGLFGDPLGLRLVGLVATFVTPVLAWRLARRVRPAWTVGAFWATACSPLLVNSAGLWAHALAAAVGGAMLLVIARSADGGLTARPILLVAALAASGALLRTEMVLWAVAVAAGWFVLDRRWRTGVAAVVMLAATGGAVVLERVIHRALVDEKLLTPAVGNESAGWIRDQLGAAWHVLFDPSHQGGLVALLALVGAGCVVAGAVRFRAAGADAAVPLFAAGAGALLVRLLMSEYELTTGLVTAWPAVVAAIIVGWQGDRRMTWLAVTAGLFTAAVLATQHPDGGGLEWGGRYLSPALLPLAVIASAGLRRLWEAGTVTRVVVAAALILPTLTGALVAADTRTRNAEIVAAVTDVGSPVVITEQPALPRIAWPSTPEVAWYRATEDDVGPLLALMARSGVPEITVQGLADEDLEGHGYAVEVVRPGLWRLVRDG